MNTSQYMDKQIMDLSNSHSNNSTTTNNSTDFINLMNPQEEDYKKKEEITPSYDFQPIRPISSPPSNSDSDNVGGARVWTSADSKINSGIRSYGSVDSKEPAKVMFEKDRNVYDAALLSEIDRTMKKHADNLLHALESVSARLSQVESRSRHLENSVDDLKASVENNHGSNDGKMRQLENILRDVEAGVQVVKDKQEILEAQLQLAKLQVSKVEHQSESQNSIPLDHVHQAASAPLQSHHQLPPISLTQPPPSHSPLNAPVPPQQNLPPSAQLPNQFSRNQISPAPQQDAYLPPSGQMSEAPAQQYQLPSQQQLDAYLPPSGQMPEAPTQQYQLPPQQQLQTPKPALLPHQQYQPSSLPQYSQPLLPQQHPTPSAVNSSQAQSQPPLGHQPEETSYIPPQNFQQSIHQPPSHLPGGAPPPQQFYGTPSHMYERQPSRPGPGFSSPYGSTSGPSEPYPYGGPSSQYGRGSPTKSQQFPSQSMGQSAGNAYPQLPTARILPQALPTASGVGSGSSSPGAGNKVPIDDVVDKVTTMGFPSDQVRATVRRLTENGQSVDLNVVLDKLMNDGEAQPPRGWFNR